MTFVVGDVVLYRGALGSAQLEHAAIITNVDPQHPGMAFVNASLMVFVEGMQGAPLWSVPLYQTREQALAAAHLHIAYPKEKP